VNSTFPSYSSSSCSLFRARINIGPVEFSTSQIPILLSLSLKDKHKHKQSPEQNHQNGCFTEAHRRRSLPLLSGDRTRSAADRRADVSSSQLVPASDRRPQELVLPRVRRLSCGGEAPFLRGDCMARASLSVATRATQFVWDSRWEALV
jgi:hypothetical protein